MTQTLRETGQVLVYGWANAGEISPAFSQRVFVERQAAPATPRMTALCACCGEKGVVLRHNSSKHKSTAASCVSLTL